jgi:hypothetical protein
MVTMRDAIASTQPKEEEQRSQELSEYQLWLQHPQTKRFKAQLEFARQDFLERAEKANMTDNDEHVKGCLASALTLNNIIKINLAQ